ncbi:cupin domain-containing protein [Bradyrhizobium sp. SSUT77]|uniref:cupin domain-containing protein n=1 Tax=Bradyrhizobium sp. SSUT77 TaxID=3040603 RepID=UPI00244923E0|nr:cupin domain-containing protein [Bradyrhizobium sp. SSUT77]MDH2343605.1 cupin domain-containing protein [Bradyrhizobium sp. SSUT77]
MTAQALDSPAFDIESVVKRSEGARFTFEYNCHLRRLFPWPNIADTKKPTTELGLIWVVVDERMEIQGHAHDEEESFVIVSGKAVLGLKGQETELRPGDVAYIPRSWFHTMKNPGDEKLVYIDLYWGLGQQQ